MEVTLDKLQTVIKSLDLPWIAGETSISGFPIEKRPRLLGLKVSSDHAKLFKRKVKEAKEKAPPTPPPIPPHTNWGRKDGNNWMTPVKNQGDCGSCVSFACIGAIEPVIKISRNDPNFSIDLSEAFLFFCGGAKCDDGWYENAALGFAKNIGITDENCFGYQDRDMLCEDNRCQDWQNRLTKIKDFVELDLLSEMKHWIANNGPVVAGMDVYDDFRFYRKGIYVHAYGDYLGAHAVVIAGYDEEEGYWICKNSWGINWGEDGWFKAKYGECGVGTNYEMYGITI